MGGSRGSDARLDGEVRATRAERRLDYHERMDAKAEARAELWTERQAGHWTDPRWMAAGTALLAMSSWRWLSMGWWFSLNWGLC